MYEITPRKWKHYYISCMLLVAQHLQIAEVCYQQQQARGTGIMPIEAFVYQKQQQYAISSISMTVLSIVYHQKHATASSNKPVERVECQKKALLCQQYSLRGSPQNLSYCKRIKQNKICNMVDRCLATQRPIDWPLSECGNQLNAILYNSKKHYSISLLCPTG